MNAYTGGRISCSRMKGIAAIFLEQTGTRGTTNKRVGDEALDSHWQTPSLGLVGPYTPLYLGNMEEVVSAQAGALCAPMQSCTVAAGAFVVNPSALPWVTNFGLFQVISRSLLLRGRENLGGVVRFFVVCCFFGCRFPSSVMSLYMLVNTQSSVHTCLLIHVLRVN